MRFVVQVVLHQVLAFFLDGLEDLLQRIVLVQALDEELSVDVQGPRLLAFDAANEGVCATKYSSFGGCTAPKGILAWSVTPVVVAPRAKGAKAQAEELLQCNFAKHMESIGRSERAPG